VNEWTTSAIARMRTIIPLSLHCFLQRCSPRGRGFGLEALRDQMMSLALALHVVALTPSLVAYVSCNVRRLLWIHLGLAVIAALLSQLRNLICSPEAPPARRMTYEVWSRVESINACIKRPGRRFDNPPLQGGPRKVSRYQLVDKSSENPPVMIDFFRQISAL